MALQIEGLDEAEVEEFGPGEIIYTKGEDADCMYVILEGEITLKVGGELVDTVEEGGFLGETAILERAPRMELAESVGDVRLLPLDRRGFEATIRRNPDMARAVLRSLARRLRKSNIAAGGSGGLIPNSRASDNTSRVLFAMKGLRTFAGGATIFKEGDPGDKMYFVQSGEVELRVGDKPVFRVETGAFFGEMALIEDAPRSASAHAVGQCNLMPVDRAKFEHLVKMTPDFVTEMMRTLANRLRKMHQKK